MRWRREGIAGTVRYYGCPAEESGSGKTFMARAGLFDDLDAAFCWHPSVVNEVQTTSSLACIQAYFRFKGRAAHAAAAPHVGRSALDAVELMNVGVNYMREHMPSDARVHYAITNTGGDAPNVVQAFAESLYLVRSPHLPDAERLFERVKKIAEGAALMTETSRHGADHRRHLERAAEQGAAGGHVREHAPPRPARLRRDRSRLCGKAPEGGADGGGDPRQREAARPRR